MMISKTSVVAMVLLATLSSEQASAQRLDPMKLVGRWAGAGTFFDADLNTRVGELPFSIEIADDRSATGHFGVATLHDVRIAPTRDRVEITAKLSGPVAADRALGKDRLVVLITALDDSTAQAEFHLKSNFVLDPRLKQGRLTLSRQR